MLVVLLLSGLPGAGAASAWAQPAPDTSALIELLKDDAARARLIAQLEAMVAAQRAAEPPPPESAGARVIAALSNKVQALSGDLVAGAGALVDVSRLMRWAEDQWTRPDKRAAWLEVIWTVLAVLGAGLAAQFAAQRVLARPARAVAEREADSPWLKLPLLVVRTVLDAVPVVGFAAASYIVLLLLEPPTVARLVALALVNASVITRASLVVARMALVPKAPGLRLLPIADETANYLFIWIGRLAAVSIYGYFLAEAALLLGLSKAGHGVLFAAVVLVVTLLVVVLILQNRAPVAGWLRGAAGPMQGLRERFADIWHVLAVVGVVALFGVWVLKIDNGFSFLTRATVLSFVILAAVGLVERAVGRVARRGFAISEEVAGRFPGLENRANRYLSVLTTAIVAIVRILAGFMLLAAWGVDSFDWLASDSGRRIAGAALTLAAIAVAAVLAWEVSSSMIERRLGDAGTQSVAVSARMRTLLPLLRNAIMVVLVTLVGLIMLAELGINIGPLLAGAGVVGLAVGFGAQTLVKDVITGIFILVEDQIAVGNVVKIGSHAGTVEELTIRTIRLRDLEGTVHVIPFSEVSTIENLTKEFSRYVFKVGVAYGQDTDAVFEVLNQIGVEMQADPDYGPLILEPLEVLGVDELADAAVFIKARITTQPIQQWKVGREFNRRLIKRFAALGIESRTRIVPVMSAATPPASA